MEYILPTTSVSPLSVAGAVSEITEVFTLPEDQLDKWLEDEAYERGFRWVVKNGYRSIDNRQNVRSYFYEKLTIIFLSRI